MKITYKDKELELKWGFRQMIVFEKLTGRMYKGESLEDNVLFMYSCAIVANDAQMPAKDFFEFIDANPKIVEEFFTELEKITSE